MAPMKQTKNNHSSSNHGEDVIRQANVLASCYLVDSVGSLKGLHYCTTSLTGLPSPPSSPPLAAITASNELALTPKKRSTVSRGSSNGTNNPRQHRRGGATLRIREECERFFCETMRAVFRGETDTPRHGSGLTGVYYYNNVANDNDDNNTTYNRYNSSTGNGQLNTPPDEFPFPDKSREDVVPGGRGAMVGGPDRVTAWLEIWDYAGGASFRAFVAEDGGEKSLFAFFDAGVIGRDLKQALMALIELAEAALGCSQLVICIDRSIPGNEAEALMKGLQWAGFSLTTLDFWAGGVDVTSRKWAFMGMEV